MTGVFVHLHHPSYCIDSHCWGDWGCGSLGKSDWVKMHPILLCWEQCSSVLLFRVRPLWGQETVWAEPAKCFLTYTRWPGLPPDPGAVKDNQSIAHSQFSLRISGKEATKKGWQRSNFWDSESPQSPQKQCKRVFLSLCSWLWLISFIMPVLIFSIYPLNDASVFQH